jgi:hypothetical protein
VDQLVRTGRKRACRACQIIRVLVTTSFQFPSGLAGGAARCVGAARRLAVLGSLCAAVVLACAAFVPMSASASATPPIDLKVLLVGTSTTEPDVTAWRSALQREGVAFDTLIESSATASGTGYTPIDVSSCPIGTTCQTLSDTASGGTPEAKYEGVVVATAGLGICSATCTSVLSASD